MSGIFHNCPHFYGIDKYINLYLGKPSLTCNYYVSGRYPSSCFYLKCIVSETGFCLRLQVKTESSLRNIVLHKNRTMDNVQKHNNCINVPSSHLFAYCLVHFLFYAVDLYIPGHFKLSVLILQKVTDFFVPVCTV
jgi:hypothetical protein